MIVPINSLPAFVCIILCLCVAPIEAFMKPTARRTTFLHTPPTSSQTRRMFHADAFATTENSMMLSMEDGGGLSGYLFPAVFLFLGIGAFLYANVVFTPEIISVNEQMALDLRQVEIRKLLSAVQKHIEAEKDLEDLRIPLEASLNLTIEEYVSKVDGGKDLGFTSADKDLANVLRVMSQ